MPLLHGIDRRGMAIKDTLMNRRDFLKTILFFVAGLTLLRWVKTLERSGVLKEARFYRSGEHLAG